MNPLITSNDCFVKNTCKKFLNPEKECECRDNDVFCIKLFKLNELYNLSMLTDKQRCRIALRIDADGTDREEFTYLSSVERDIKKFVASGNNLYIYSTNVGNGKTTWAIRLIQSYLNSIWYTCNIECKALFVSVPRYLLAIKDSISNANEYADQVKQGIYKADLVIFDDIATKSATQYEHEVLFNLIDARINDGKCNVFTSNLNYDGLTNAVGERIASRIFNTSLSVELKGKDKRALGVTP